MRVLTTLAAACLLMKTSVVAAEIPVIRLDGNHRFSVGDDADWSQLEFDDSAWQRVAVPGAWGDVQEASHAGIGWYRIHFSLPNVPRDAELAVLLGPISDADETWLNGHRIGHTGGVGRDFYSACRVIRAYDVPAELLQTGENVLAVRVHRRNYSGGILSHPRIEFPYLGSAGRIDALVSSIESQVTVTFAVLATIWSFGILLGCVLLLNVQMRTPFLWLSAFMSIVLLSYLAECPWFVRQGWHSAHFEQIVSLAIAVSPWVFLQVVSTMLLQPLKSTIRVATAGLTLNLCWIAVSVASRSYSYVLWSCLLAAAFVTSSTVILCTQAIRRRISGAKVFAAGAAIVPLSLTWQLVPNNSSALVFDLTQDALAVGAALFVLCGLAVLATRFSRLRQQVETALAALSTAESEERQRIRRDLHDGVFQSITAIRWGLLSLTREHTATTFPDRDRIHELADQTLAVNRELRRVLSRLSLEAIETRPFHEAIEELLHVVQSLAEIEFDFQCDESLELTTVLKEHIYRILQEATHNVVRHADATHVTIQIHQDGPNLLVKCQDNGCGFDPHQIDAPGLGLKTIQERTQFIDGRLQIQSPPGAGTTLTIQVPLPPA